MANEADVLLQVWREQRDQARQCEDQRAVMTNIVLVLASAAIGLIVQRGISGQIMLLVSVPLMLLGVYGAITSLKYRERFAYHHAQARALMHRLDKLYPDLHLEEDKAAAIERHGKLERYARLYPVRLGRLWVGLHIAIAIIGFVLTIAIAT